MQSTLFPSRTDRPPRVALVHDYLLQDGGAERLLLTLQEIFPDAPTFTLFYDPNRAHPAFRNKKIYTSMLQRWPLTRKHEHWTLPFMPMAVEHLDLSGYDLVISSASSFAKGVIVAPETRHISYIHTPTRFLWHDRLGYVNDLPRPRVIKRILPFLLHRLRQWDRIASARPDVLVTNSETSRRRIARYYGREAIVIAPPVDVASIPAPQSSNSRSYWLTGGRLVGYKRFDLTIKAFAKLNLPLKVFGTGPEFRKLKKFAGPQTEFLGRVSDETKQQLYAGAIGFIHPQVEDFGITAIEAMAAGKPVIAYREGGGAETVRDGITGRLIEAQTWEDIGDAIIRFEPQRYDPDTIRRHAETYGTERFKELFRNLVQETLQSE